MFKKKKSPLTYEKDDYTDEEEDDDEEDTDEEEEETEEKVEPVLKKWMTKSSLKKPKKPITKTIRRHSRK